MKPRFGFDVDEGPWSREINHGHPSPHAAAQLIRIVVPEALQALKGERLILPSPASMRSLIDQHLAQAGVTARPAMVLNRLDTVIAMVEAGEGTGIVPSSALPVCQRRHVVMSRLINPTVPVDFFQIRNRGRKLSPAAEEFTTFLQGYIARWAGRAGVP
jgi:LysR family transcriptional regulator, carnitine catabolism transcriptional activator